MAISYTTDSLVVTDDAAPDREPLVLPLSMDRDEQDAAVAAYLAIPPAPDWAAFKSALLGSHDVKEALVSAVGVEPPAALALPAATMTLELGSVENFRLCWATLREAGLITNALRDQISALATSCHMPADVLAVINANVQS
jgi:hypothetical protein